MEDLELNNIVDDKFEESDYLEMYPDVKEAVDGGQFASGLAHFKKHGRSEGRLPNKKNFLSRQDKILFGVNRAGLGLEIGPSHNPVAPKSEGFNVHILDVESQEGLRAKYQGHGVNLDNIEPVDFVWDGRPITELVGKANCYDFIIASHVIEHVPDFITFLQECEKLLAENGILSLVVPDKRYCFDYFSPLTTTGNIVDAWKEKRTRPTPGQIFDYFANSAKRGESIAWANDGSGGATRLSHEFDEAKAYYQKTLNSEEYIDVHCWRFIPNSFELIISDLSKLHFIKLTINKKFKTEGCEFYISLTKKDNVAEQNNRLKFLQAIID
jgi:predicted SAM-dependent methyltransferase